MKFRLFVFCIALLCGQSLYAGSSASGQEQSFVYTDEVARYLQWESNWKYQEYEPSGEMEQGDLLKKEEKPEVSPDTKSSFLDFGVMNIDWLIWTLVGVIFVIIAIAMFVILSQQSAGSGNKVDHKFMDETFDSLHANENLERVLKSGDYNEAIRIVYLRTLEWLEQRKMIQWEKSKTAIEYYYELTSEKRKPMMRELTEIFLMARYDDVVADVSMYEKAAECSEQICTNRK